MARERRHQSVGRRLTPDGKRSSQENRNKNLNCNRVVVKKVRLCTKTWWHPKRSYDDLQIVDSATCLGVNGGRETFSPYWIVSTSNRNDRICISDGRVWEKAKRMATGDHFHLLLAFIFFLPAYPSSPPFTHSSNVNFCLPVCFVVISCLITFDTNFSEGVAWFWTDLKGLFTEFSLSSHFLLMLVHFSPFEIVRQIV